MGLLREFKDFAMRGNVLDLAVGVVIGGAFGKIVDSLVKNLILPIVGFLTKGIDLAKLNYTPRIPKGVKTDPPIIAYGAFLQSVVDFVIIAALFVPGIRENAALLRLLRLLRVARLLKYLPDVQVLLRGATRAIRPATGLGVLTGLLVFLYGMVGWTLFADLDPTAWGNIGRAMLSLFSILTLEGWTTTFALVFEAKPLESVLFFLSFILLGTFVVLNLLLGIMIGSLEEVRQEERIRQGGDTADIEARIRDLREALDAVEHGLRTRRD